VVSEKVLSRRADTGVLGSEEGCITLLRNVGTTRSIAQCHFSRDLNLELWKLCTCPLYFFRIFKTTNGGRESLLLNYY